MPENLMGKYKFYLVIMGSVLSLEWRYYVPEFEVQKYSGEEMSSYNEHR